VTALLQFFPCLGDVRCGMIVDCIVCWCMVGG
jgi:hypothetical protein